MAPVEKMAIVGEGRKGGRRLQMPLGDGWGYWWVSPTLRPSHIHILNKPGILLNILEPQFRFLAH